MNNAAVWALIIAVFFACFVETVEATTIVMAMGFTRGWRSAVAGTLTGLALLAVFTIVAGYALANWLEPAILKLAIGTLLLIFGLQWLRKAIYRSAGLKAMHDEDEIFQREVAAAQAAGGAKPGLDMFAFMISLKGVFLEGVEVVFIVLTFGLSARATSDGTGPDPVLVASIGAAAAIAVVLVIAVVARRPLSMIPENTLKYGVAVLLVAFGLYWSISGLGAFFGEPDGLSWPGADLAIVAGLAAALLLSRVLIAALRRSRPKIAAEGDTVQERSVSANETQVNG